MECFHLVHRIPAVACHSVRARSCLPPRFPTDVSTARDSLGVPGRKVSQGDCPDAIAVSHMLSPLSP